MTDIWWTADADADDLKKRVCTKKMKNIRCDEILSNFMVWH